MALDSPAAFLERVQELQLAAHIDRFNAARWTTMAALAFSSPHSGNEEALVNNILIPGLGRADHPDHMLLRRLFFEAFLMASADLKRRSEATAENGPRIVPAA